MAEKFGVFTRTILRDIEVLSVTEPIYPIVYRTSNNIDLLVHPDDVTGIGNALLKNGFKQGNIRNCNFEPATRKEIIKSIMMSDETEPR